MTVTEECKRTSKLFPVSEAKQSLRGTTGMRFSCGAENEVGGFTGYALRPMSSEEAAAETAI